MYGKLIGCKVDKNKVSIEFEGGSGIIEVITPSIINVFSPLKYKEHFSRAVEDIKAVPGEVKIDKTQDKLVITTEKITVHVFDGFKADFYDNCGNILSKAFIGEREPFGRRGNGSIAEGEGHTIEKNKEEHKIEVIMEMLGGEHFYGFGEKTGHLDKKGYSYEMWNTDDPKPHVENYKALYKSIPFFITLRDNTASGIFFDNTHKSYFDMGKENSSYYYFGADDGNLDYYFIYGPQITEVIGGYTYLTGRTPLPQKWTLGYQQCRWSYAPESRIWELAENFRGRDIPCDALYLDIDYMDGFRVFTWDKNKFENPKEMTEKLQERGFKLVTIIDPGVKKDRGYGIYEEGLEKGYFATDKDGVPYVNEVWPGDSLYPDFSDEKVRSWWAENQRIMLESGVSGIWNDMNEPASFRGPLPDDVQFKNDGRPTNHLEVHNVYGHLMSKATYEGIKEHSGKRPFVITRACYAGTQKYSTVWTGDNHSFWEHLRMSVPMLLNLGLSGFAFAGTDVGGFSFDCTGELLSRWVQVGAFTPLFRNHSCIHTRDQEPWAFDRETEDINRKYIKLRYRLLPYLYDTMWSSETTGLPVMRPLMLHYQQDEKTLQINDQFLFGENIMVAPVLEQGKKAREVYLPAGKWFDYWTGEVHEGGNYIIKHAPLDICPIYIRQGSIIPNYADQSYVGERKMEELILDVYPGKGNYTHYIDDGETFGYREGKYNLYSLDMENEDRLIIKVNKAYNGYSDDYARFSFRINGVKADEVLVNGKAVSFEATERGIEFIVENRDSVIEIGTL